MPIGVSTGHPDTTAGTNRARVTGGTNVFALSNNYVYANGNNATAGDNPLQPGPFDGGANLADSIGTLYDFEPIVFDDTNANNVMDAAVVLSPTAKLGNATLLGGYGSPNATPISASIGQSVQKYGRTANLTVRQVSELNVTIDVCYEGVSNCTKWARFNNQIAVSDGSFSAGGDSESLIVTNDTNKNPLGLLFTANSTRTIANDIGLVLTRFGVTIDGDGSGTPPPPSSILSVTVTTDKASYTNRENVQITVGVDDGSDPVQDSSVHVRVTTADGDILGGDSTTNSAGLATFRYKVNSKRAGVITYTLDATATKSGFDPGSGSTTFEVKNQESLPVGKREVGASVGQPPLCYSPIKCFCAAKSTDNCAPQSVIAWNTAGGLE